MITIVAKMRIKSDKTADAEKALLDMGEYVRANERGRCATRCIAASATRRNC
jgi:hypothetical protein